MLGFSSCINSYGKIITWHTQAQSFIGSGTMYNLNTNIYNWPGSLTWSPKLSGYSVCPRPSLPRLGVWDKLDPSLCLRVSRWHRGYWGPIRGPNFGCSRHGPKPQTIVNKSVSKRRSILGSDCMTEDWLFLKILSRTDRAKNETGKIWSDFRTSGLSLDKILFIALSSYIVDTACAVLRVLWLTPQNCTNTIIPLRKADCPRSICAPQTPALPWTPRQYPTWSPCSRRKIRSCPRSLCRKKSVLHPWKQNVNPGKGTICPHLFQYVSFTKYFCLNFELVVKVKWSRVWLNQWTS